jgi:hypothetical protein
LFITGLASTMPGSSCSAASFANWTSWQAGSVHENACTQRARMWEAQTHLPESKIFCLRIRKIQAGEEGVALQFRSGAVGKRTDGRLLGAIGFEDARFKSADPNQVLTERFARAVYAQFGYKGLCYSDGWERN